MLVAYTYKLYHAIIYKKKVQKKQKRKKSNVCKQYKLIYH